MYSLLGCFNFAIAQCMCWRIKIASKRSVFPAPEPESKHVLSIITRFMDSQSSRERHKKSIRQQVPPGFCETIMNVLQLVVHR